MARLTQRDVRALLELLGDLYALRSLDAFRTAVPSAVPRVVGAEITAYSREAGRSGRVGELADTCRCRHAEQRVWEQPGIPVDPRHRLSP